MRSELVFLCRENDAEIRAQFLDGSLDEIHVGVRGIGDWTVIGANDLIAFIDELSEEAQDE